MVKSCGMYYSPDKTNLLIVYVAMFSVVTLSMIIIFKNYNSQIGAIVKCSLFVLQLYTLYIVFGATLNIFNLDVCKVEEILYYTNFINLKPHDIVFLITLFQMMKVKIYLDEENTEREKIQKALCNLTTFQILVIVFAILSAISCAYMGYNF